MSDIKIRETERAARRGDPEAMQRWFRERARSGDRLRPKAPPGALHDGLNHRGAYEWDEVEFREILRLRAYAEDEAALEFLGFNDYSMYDHIPGICHCGECSWERGPSEWTKHLLINAHVRPFGSLRLKQRKGEPPAGPILPKGVDFAHYLANAVSTSVAKRALRDWYTSLLSTEEEVRTELLVRVADSPGAEEIRSRLQDVMSRIEKARSACEKSIQAADNWLECPCQLRLDQWTDVTDGSPPFAPYPAFSMVRNNPTAHWQDQVCDAKRYLAFSDLREVANNAVLEAVPV